MFIDFHDVHRFSQIPFIYRLPPLSPTPSTWIFAGWLAGWLFHGFSLILMVFFCLPFFFLPFFLLVAWLEAGSRAVAVRSGGWRDKANIVAKILREIEGTNS